MRNQDSYSFPITAISKLLRLDEPDRHLSPMDMFLDLWFHGTVCDPYTAGSVLMPVVHLELNQKVYKECMENEKILDPRVHLDDLAVRWNCSKSTVSRRLALLCRMAYWASMRHIRMSGITGHAACVARILQPAFFQTGECGTRSGSA